MLATRQDQENLATLRQGPAKNMGPAGKTPLKVPLNDENAASVIGGKTGGLGVGGKGVLKSTMKAQATPMGR